MVAAAEQFTQTRLQKLIGWLVRRLWRIGHCSLLTTIPVARSSLVKFLETLAIKNRCQLSYHSVNHYAIHLCVRPLHADHYPDHRQMASEFVRVAESDYHLRSETHYTDHQTTVTVYSPTIYCMAIESMPMTIRFEGPSSAVSREVVDGRCQSCNSGIIVWSQEPPGPSSGRVYRFTGECVACRQKCHVCKPHPEEVNTYE